MGFLPRTPGARGAVGRGRAGLRQSPVGGFWKELQGAKERTGTEPMTMTVLDQVEAEEGEKADPRSAVRAKLTQFATRVGVGGLGRSDC